MHRKSFLQHLTALGAFGFIPTKALTHYRKLYLLQCFVAGFKYYKGMELLPQMKEGDMLELVREPANEYDDCAIALHWNKEKIGFIPATENPILSRLMDGEALELIAEITHLNKQVQPWENLSVAVYYLKEVVIGDTPANMQYLTELETPSYTSYKHSSGNITRVQGNERYENNTDWYSFLVKHSKDDSIYSIIHGSNVSPVYEYGKETGEYLLVNKNRLPANEAIQKIIQKAEETLGTLDNLFDEEGYIVLTTREAAALVPKLERITAVVDKLGREFIELVL